MCRRKSAESIAHNGAIPRRRFESCQMFSPNVVPVKQAVAYAPGLDMYNMCMCMCMYAVFGRYMYAMHADV